MRHELPLPGRVRPDAILAAFKLSEWGTALTEQKPTPNPVLELARFFQQSQVDRIVRQALEFRDRPGASPSKNAFNAALRKASNRKRPVVQGFKDPTQARAAKLREPCQWHFGLDEDLTRALLLLWADANQPLKAAVSEAMERAEQPVLDLATPASLEGGVARTVFDAVITAVTTLHPAFPAEDARVMQVLLSQRMPRQEPEAAALLAKGPATPPQAQQTLADPAQVAAAPTSFGEAWAAFENALQEVPPSDPAWANLSTYVDRLTSFAREKASVLELIGQRAAMAKTLEALQARHAGALEHLELSLAHWTTENVDGGALAGVQAVLDALDVGLGRQPALQQHLASVRSSERKAATQRLDATEEEIRSRFAELGALLARKDAKGEAAKTTTAWPALPEAPPAPLVAKPEAAAAPVEAKVADPNAAEPPYAVVKEAVVEPPPAAAAPEAPPLAEVPVASEQAMPASSPQAAAPAAENVSKAVPEQPVPEPMPPAGEAPREAARTANTGTPQDWTRLQLDLLKADDLAAAYWLERSLSGRVPLPLSAPVLACAFGAQAVADGRTPLAVLMAPELLEFATSSPPGTPEEAMLSAVSAGILVLQAPEAGLLEWLDPELPFTPLRSWVATVRQFALRNELLHPEDLGGQGGRHEREVRGKQLRDAMAQWFAQAPHKKQPIAAATEVWRYVYEKELRQVLAPALEGRRSGHEALAEALKSWTTREFVHDRLDEIRVELKGRRSPAITGPAREKAILAILEVAELARQWLDVARVEADHHQRGSAHAEAVRQLVQGLTEEAPAVMKALRDTTQAHHDTLGAAAQVATRLLERFHAALGLEETRPAPASAAAPHALLAQEAMATTAATPLAEALASRLLLLPSLTLDGQRRLSSEGLLAVAKALDDEATTGTSLPAVILEWARAGDFRFMEPLLSVVEAGEAERLRSELSQLRGTFKVRCAERRREVEALVEQAFIDGVADHKRRAALLAPLPSAEPGDDPRHYLGILQRVADEVKKDRVDKAEVRRNRWRDIRESLPTLHLETGDEERLAARIGRALDDLDTRLADELMGAVESALTKGTSIPPSLITGATSATLLEEFRKASVPAASEVVRSVLEQGGSVLLPGWSDLPAKEQEAAEVALKAWMRAKTGGPSKLETAGQVATLLRFVGLEFQGIPSAARDGEKADSVTFSVQATGAPAPVPVPHYGSKLKKRKLTVTMVWERKGVDTLTPALRALGNEPGVVIYLGTIAQRVNVAHNCRTAHLEAIVLDESLLVFLATKAGRRFEAFLSCAVPFASLTPYTPFLAGDVPLEMFYGRESTVRELANPQGPCIVFGGRQLGKSALLRRVQRELHAPPDRLAVVLDIRTVGDPHAKQGPEAIWPRLAAALKDEGITTPNRGTKAEAVIPAIREWLAGSAERRLTLMFDEADHFLDADVPGQFANVDWFRQLMVGAGPDEARRVKVIFAGLHNVQRFQAIPNQPLAHFGTPQIVGPLDPADAMRLVQEPLAALGFNFGSTDDVLRILSYTNYHPGLVQLYCEELLKRLHTMPTAVFPPKVIGREDVEAVYRTKEIQQGIKDRLNWTLALDPRYQAIAWTMIVYAGDSSEREAWKPADVQELAGMYVPQIRDLKADELGAVLDEMEGLGILIRTTDGAYQLRNPNIAHLVRSEDLESRLNKLGKVDLDYGDVTQLHALLPLDPKRYSPFTHAQEAALLAGGPRVEVVVGSKALGLDNVDEALKRLVTAPEPSKGRKGGQFEEAPGDWSRSSRLDKWLASLAKVAANGSVVIARVSVSGDADPSAAVETARKLVALQEARSGLRVVFVLDPSSTWAWLNGGKGQPGTDGVLALARWRPIAVKQFLNHQDKMDAEDNVKAVSRVTGGWPCHVVRVVEQWRAHEKPDRVLAELGKALQGGSELRRSFEAEAGLQVGKNLVPVMERLWRGERAEDLAKRPPEGVAPERVEVLVRYLTLLGHAEPWSTEVASASAGPA